MLTTIAPGTSSAKLEPYVYTPESIPLMWDELESVLQRCFDRSYGMLDPQQVRHWLMHGLATAFATVRDGRIVAAFIVMKVDYPTYSVARILLCAGKDLRGAMRFVDALDAWALTQGCVEIDAWCRPGMARLVRRWGWHHKLAIVSRDLRRKLQ